MIRRSFWTFSAGLVVITCAVAFAQAEQVRRETGPTQVPIGVLQTNRNSRSILVQVPKRQCLASPQPEAYAQHPEHLTV